MEAFAPTVARLADAVVELRTLEVSYRSIADGLGCTENHARLLRFRALKGADAHLQRPDWRLLQQPNLVEWAQLRRRFGVRLEEDAVLLSRTGKDRLEWLRGAIADVWTEFGGTFRSDEAIKRLRKLREQKGYAASAERFRIFGELSRALAFFNVHIGRTRSAAAFAVEAAYLHAFAQHESGNPQDWLNVAAACELCAHAHSLAAQPAGVRAALNIAAEAKAAAGQPLGADHLRLRGVAFYQLGAEHDAEAIRAFDESAQLTTCQPTGSPMSVEMNGARHTNAILAEPDAARELSINAGATFGPKSLQASMTAHWAAVAGLMTDSSQEHEQALEVVERNLPVASQFGHQASIAKLLRAIPRLHLSDPQRQAWVRYSLYANAYRID